MHRICHLLLLAGLFLSSVSLTVSLSYAATVKHNKPVKAYTKADDYKTINFLREAAEKGDSGSAYNLGVLYNNGYGAVPQDYEQAFYWFTVSAKANNPLAQINLANMYLKGKSTNQNFELARYWYDIAAKHNNVGAQHMLGIIYSKKLSS